MNLSKDFIDRLLNTAGKPGVKQFKLVEVTPEKRPSRNRLASTLVK